MKAQLVRDEVRDFRIRVASGRNEADCFPAWYLNRRYGVAPSDAIQQTANAGEEGGHKGYDHGIDAFHLVSDDSGPARLLLIQAKYSETLPAIAGGFKDLSRGLDRIVEALRAEPSGAARENRVIVNLRDRLRRIGEEDRQRLQLEFVVLHLFDGDPMALRSHARRQWEDLKEAVRERAHLRDLPFLVDEIGPPRLIEQQPGPEKPPQQWFPLNMPAVPLTADVEGRNVTMHSGIGHLADLVDMYHRRRGDLFAKNVRYFLTSKQNVERGPSGKIRETLRQMCVPARGRSTEPELFAFHHNGVTIFARDVEYGADGTVVQIRDPFILNGCQTVRSAYDFRFDPRLADRVDDVRWRRVAVPIRVITTPNEELIRQITVSNNRQNQIPPSALRANDRIQLEIEARLAGRGVFYERQKGAFSELERSNSARLDDFPNTNGRAVNIDDLARSLAAVAAEFDLAVSPSHIFEYDATYDRTFSSIRLASTTLLVALQNLHDVLPIVLKKDLGLTPSAARSPRPSRVTYYALCLLLRYLVKARRLEWIEPYGHALVGRQTLLREELVRLLGNRHSCIKRALQDHFLSLPDSNADALRNAFERAEASLGLRSTVDVFGAFAALEAREPSR